MLKNAGPIVDRVDSLKMRKYLIKKVIELQDQLIKAKDVNVKSFETTIQNEIKSYSSVVQESCGKTLSAQKISEVVEKVVDKDDRSKNLVVYGVVEAENENLDDILAETLQHITEKLRIKDCCRIGKQKDGVIRPIKVSLYSTDIVSQILNKSKLLKSVEGYRSVYLCPD